MRDSAVEGAPLRISLNGAAREVAAGASVADLLRTLALASERVAVERNGALVPRREHEHARLAADDRIEIVTLVGGG